LVSTQGRAELVLALGRASQAQVPSLAESAWAPGQAVLAQVVG